MIFTAKLFVFGCGSLEAYFCFKILQISVEIEAYLRNEQVKAGKIIFEGKLTKGQTPVLTVRSVNHHFILCCYFLQRTKNNLYV